MAEATYSAAGSVQGQDGILSTTKKSEWEENEPTNTEHCRVIASGFVTASAAYGFSRLFVPSERAEDIVDILHSLGTSCTAFYGVSQMEKHPLHTRGLPPHLVAGTSPVVRMFNLSLGYFGADFTLIMIDILFRNKFPNLWIGRLAHHTVQFFANRMTIFVRQENIDVIVANRSILCAAYMAEFSSVFLRLSNLGRRGPVAMRSVINWMLVATFFATRIVNFPFLMGSYFKCRDIFPRRMLVLFLAVTSSGFGLSAAWFPKIVKIALKSAASVEVMPSIEC